MGIKIHLVEPELAPMEKFLNNTRKHWLYSHPYPDGEGFLGGFARRHRILHDIEVDMAGSWCDIGTCRYCDEDRLKMLKNSAQGDADMATTPPLALWRISYRVTTKPEPAKGTKKGTFPTCSQTPTENHYPDVWMSISGELTSSDQYIARQAVRKKYGDDAIIELRAVYRVDEDENQIVLVEPARSTLCDRCKRFYER